MVCESAGVVNELRGGLWREGPHRFGRRGPVNTWDDHPDGGDRR